MDSDDFDLPYHWYLQKRSLGINVIINSLD
jgi:hypothetical protein